MRLSDGCKRWTKPFPVDDDSSQTISIPFGKDESALVFISVTRASGSQKQVRLTQACFERLDVDCIVVGDSQRGVADDLLYVPPFDG